MIIEKIDSPTDLKKLSMDELKLLSDELRQIIIQTVSVNGGHLASSLGAIEITIALHYVFNAPKDKIVWDVGHQSYSHKLLTGRKDRFSTIRKENGLSGFPKIAESEYDAFGTGHSSTSISAALGIIEGRDKNKEDFKVIAVIGDGAMTGGLAFEGLNNAGHLKKDLIVILNDNEMSISPNVGALSAYLNRILTGEFYRKFKKKTKSFLEGIPKVGGQAAKIAQKAEETIKGILLPGILFEELGFDYVGPIDGHNTALLIETLKRIKSSASPTLVHVITKKGKGYEFSEKNPCGFHGVGPFELETGSQVSSKNSMSYSNAFGNFLTELATDDQRIIAVSAAMKEGTGLDCFAAKFPDRFYDVGIAEPHAVTFAAGLASQGLKPVVVIYSTFLQRAYDEIVHDVCLQKLPVIFAIDRAGIVGEDGPTHQGLFDISFLRHIPNLVFMAPKDRAELKQMLEFAMKYKGPSAIRYPRGEAPEALLSPNEVIMGKGEILQDGTDIALLAIGSCVIPALNAAKKLERDGINAAVINARFIKPLDRELILSISSIPKIITIEENNLQGGFGSSALECLNDSGVTAKVRRLGIPDRFVEQGHPDRLRARYGLDEEGIYLASLSFLREPAFSN
ncbi:MAG: 1-deoxy-D-xylulose-5-phosphate synthase [Nitrospira bacterium HGW-Nitrospira-1]|nr:MAG: 1-deoxy-D-xylulose-5-phosphate synthase [Nitrospira bacterium HGW-Nitrospira-1]